MKEFCPECGIGRYGSYQYCPKCGHKYEAVEPKRHPATYKKCKDCKFFRYYKKGEIVNGKEIREWRIGMCGVCECDDPKRKFRRKKMVGKPYISDGMWKYNYKIEYTNEDGGYRYHTTKACRFFQERDNTNENNE